MQGELGKPAGVQASGEFPLFRAFCFLGSKNYSEGFFGPSGAVIIQKCPAYLRASERERLVPATNGVRRPLFWSFY